MQRLILNIPVGSFLPGDGFRVYGNVDGLGRTTASVDFDRPFGGREAEPFWPLLPTAAGYVEGSEGEGPYLGVPEGTPDDRQVRTPLLYFGVYRFAVVPCDALGNVAAGTPAEFAAVVNSGPRPVRNFRQTGVSGGGRPVFAFVRPGQLG